MGAVTKQYHVVAGAAKRPVVYIYGHVWRLGPHGAAAADWLHMLSKPPQMRKNVYHVAQLRQLNNKY